MGIGGHIRPMVTALVPVCYILYVKTYYPEIQADVYLDNPKPVFGQLIQVDEIKQSWTVTKSMTFLLPVM